MAKGARASVLKRNKSTLKKKVFGPVELARNQRLSSKLMELARMPRPPREEMEVEQTEADKSGDSETKTAEVEMDVDEGAATKDSKSQSSGAGSERKSGRIQKSRHRRTRNELTFRKHPMKKVKKQNARKR